MKHIMWSGLRSPLAIAEAEIARRKGPNGPRVLELMSYIATRQNRIEDGRYSRLRQTAVPSWRVLALPLLAILLGACETYAPFHPNTAAEPFNSVRGPADGRYKLAFIEFGDQGSPLDNSQRKAALEVIHKTR
ncbi:MAG TPA: hypothetical protein VJS37_05795, partial [Terriglobales bacterium]|nr:hypothetical protein [Terriglobales bacterium]